MKNISTILFSKLNFLIQEDLQPEIYGQKYHFTMAEDLSKPSISIYQKSMPVRLIFMN
jgi:hypothetical protein